MDKHTKNVLKIGMKSVEKVYQNYLVDCLKSRETALMFEEWFPKFVDQQENEDGK